MSADGYIAVPMSADECINNEGSKNKANRAPNGRTGHVLGGMINVKKCFMLATIIMVRREGQGEH